MTEYTPMNYVLFKIPDRTQNNLVWMFMIFIMWSSGGKMVYEMLMEYLMWTLELQYDAGNEQV